MPIETMHKAGRALPMVPWTNVYGLARSILAVATMITLLVHDSNALFSANGALQVENVRDLIVVTRLSLFALCPHDHLEIARALSIGLLLLVASGWRPRITGVLHWWIAFSFAVSCVIPDGGDQVAAVLTFLLIPVTLTDDRRWHWIVRRTPAGKSAGVLASTSLWIVRLQVAIVYLHAAVAKTAVEEWVNGTAVYYWFTHPVFGFAEPVRPVVIPLLTNPFVVVLLTWGAMALELVLFTGLFINKRWWPKLLAAGIAFHAAIAVAHGLFTFSLIMVGALVLFLRAPENEFHLRGGGDKHPFGLRSIPGENRDLTQYAGENR